MDSPGAQDNSPDARVWIVLVQKSAKGPFTYVEVCELIDKGIIRRNDPAMKLGKESGKSSGQWKLLYQYPEFDRRTAEPVEPTSLGNFSLPSEGERRNADAQKAADEQLGALMPEQLTAIQPEDLIQHHTSRELRVADPEAVEVGFASDSGRPPDDEPGFPRWIVAVTLLAVVGGLFTYAGRDKWTKPEPPPGTPAVASESPANPAFPPRDGRRLSSRPNVVQPPVFRGGAPARPNVPPPAVEVLPAQRPPEPFSRKEESKYDCPADSDLKRDGERGEISEEDDSRREEDRDGDEPAPRRPAAKKAKAAISEEEESPSDNNNESGDDNGGNRDDNRDSSGQDDSN